MITEHENWRIQLRQGSREERVFAAENLSYLGEDAAFATEELVSACGEEEAISEWAIAALEQIVEPPPEAVAALGDRVNSPKPLVAYWAVTLLGRLGPQAAEEAERLCELLRNEHVDLSVREKAAWAVGEIGPAAACCSADLEALTQSHHPRLSRLASHALSSVQASHA